MALDQPQPAAASYEQACQCDPGNADAWVGRSRALFKLGEDEQALDCLEKGVVLDDKPPFLAELMRYRQKQARWDDLPALWARVLAQLDEHNAYSMAFPMLAHPGATGADLLRSARACMAAERAKLPRPLPARPKPPEPVPAPAAGRPLRVGYLSGDLRDHAVSYLLAGVFEAHDRSAFRVIGIDACAKAVSDTPMRQRVLAAFDESIALGRCTPEEAASRIRALRLDVLIDLMGATGDGQAGVLMLRPAPLQVTWLGFPGSSGMDEIDYILADRHVAPPGSEGEFSECIVRLPDTFQPNDSQRAISPAVPTRASQGLPENALSFAATTAPTKCCRACLISGCACSRKCLAACSGSSMTASTFAPICARRPRGVASTAGGWSLPGAAPTATTWPATAWPICSWTPCPLTPAPPPATRSGPACPCSRKRAAASQAAWPPACCTPWACPNSSRKRPMNTRPWPCAWPRMRRSWPPCASA